MPKVFLLFEIESLAQLSRKPMLASNQHSAFIPYHPNTLNPHVQEFGGAAQELSLSLSLFHVRSFSPTAKPTNRTRTYKHLDKTKNQKSCLKPPFCHSDGTGEGSTDGRLDRKEDRWSSRDPRAHAARV